MDEVAVPKREVHYQQSSDRRRRRELRIQRRADGKANPPRRAWKRGRTTYFHADNDGVIKAAR